MRFPVVGPGYLGRSPNLNASRSINFYAERGGKESKDVIALVGTPGTLVWTIADINTGNSINAVRGLHPFNGQLFALAGGQLHEVTASGLVQPSMGTLMTSTDRVLMADNGISSAGAGGNQIMIVDGVDGYIYNIATDTFSTISGGGWPTNPTALTYIDGYFVIATKNGMTIYASNLYDGTTWTTLAQSPVSAAPDTVQSLIALYEQLWVIKQYSSEIWYNSGTATSVGFPFQRETGAVLDYGTSAPWSVARGDNGFLFLANQRQNDQGEMAGVVYISGTSPSPTLVTPPAIVYQWSKYGTITDAFAYTYADGGHEFYVLTFPTANATWAYDMTTQLWHERSTWTAGVAYATGRHVGNCYAYFAGKHLIGDYQTGAIYEMADGVYSDVTALGDTIPLVSTRTCEPIFDNQELYNVFFHRLEIDMETGVGNQTVNNPQAALSWSDDGGYTWSNEYLASLGSAGAFKTRAIWRRLGCSRSRVFRVSISDPVKRLVMGGYLD